MSIESQNLTSAFKKEKLEATEVENLTKEKNMYMKPLVDRTCLLCQKKFQTRIENQIKCPQCIDAKKGKAEFQQTVIRKCLDSWILHIQLSREKFQVYDTGNNHTALAKRAIYRGKDGGEVSWHGRMDVFIATEHLIGSQKEEDYDFFPSVGRVRLMEVEKKVGNSIKYEDTGKELSFPEKRQYLAIDTLENISEEDIDGILIYHQCTSKYTLKGLGRQYSAQFHSEECVWSYEMSCSCRSGRINVHSVLAIVNKKNPLIKVFKENGAIETTYFPIEAEKWYIEKKEKNEKKDKTD